MSEFDILYVSQKAIKRSVIVGFLTKRANEEYEPMSFDFPNEDLMQYCKLKKKNLPKKMVGRCTLTKHRTP